MSSVTTPFVVSAPQRLWRGFDIQLLVYIVLLVILGLVMGYSATYGAAPTGGGLPQTVKTLIWAAIGLAGFFVAANIDYHWLSTFSAPIYVAVLGLLTLTMAIGTNLFGAQMSISVAGLDFQVSEISKVLMVVVLASYLQRRSGRIGRLTTIIGAATLIAIPTLLVYRQPDLGTALVFVAILIGMLFISGASIGWMALLGGGVVAMAPILISALHGYQRQRLFCFLDPSSDPQGACYQLLQSLNAVGSGGLLGQGLTAGRQNQLGFLPVQSTDFIFSVVAEELGFVGGLLMLALFGLLLWRILLISWRARDGLGRLIASGLATVILFQLLVNVGMVVGVMPVTGIPLPFITYGGSSMVSMLVGMGLVESVRMRTDKPTF